RPQLQRQAHRTPLLNTRVMRTTSISAPRGRAHSSESQSRVLVPTFRALEQLRACAGRVKRVAADAMEDGLAPFKFEAPVIAPVVIQPQPEKDRAHDHAVDQDTGGKIKQGTNYDLRGTS